MVFGGSRVNVNNLSDLYKQEIFKALDQCVGTKTIIWDDDLTGPMDLITDSNLFKDNDAIEMFTLSSGRSISPNSNQVVFFVKPQLHLMPLVAKIVHREEKSRSSKKDFNLFFIPCKNLLCEKRLKELGVFGTFNISSNLDILWFPLDTDVITTDMKSCFKSCHVESDCGSLHGIARALLKLESIYGPFRRICGKGICSLQVWTLLQKLHRESGFIPNQTDSSHVHTLLLIDRQTDVLSPLVTPLTYEGLIDDIFGIKYNKVRMPAEKFTSRENSDTGGGSSTVLEENEWKVLMLNSNEELFSEIRDKNFNAVGALLSKKAREVAADFEARHDMKSVSEVKKFVSRLPKLQAVRNSLATHTSSAELIKEVTDSEDFLESLHVEQEILNCSETDRANPYIEDCIAKLDSFYKVLRLICLQSVVNGGFKQKLLEYYWKELTQTYGFEHILSLQNLQKAGILMPQGRSWYPSLRRLWNLTATEVSETDPKDPAYVHSGFCPLTIRLCQHAAKKGMDSLNDVLTQLPGQTFDDYPYGASGTENQDPPTTLVFFVGGCTFAEIAALRFLSQQEDAPTEYIIGTTDVINATTFMKGLEESVEQEKPMRY